MPQSPDHGSAAAQISRLEAKANIRQVLAGYFDAVQRRDWAAVSDVFVPSAHLDYGTPGVSGVAENIKLLRVSVDDDQGR